MTDIPPRESGWPEEQCSVPVCGRRTNNGIYVDADTLQRITLALAG
jgi:hypothetical protein